MVGREKDKPPYRDVHGAMAAVLSHMAPQLVFSKGRTLLTITLQG